MDLYNRGAWLTEWAPRDRRWLPAPSWYDGRRALSGTLLPSAPRPWTSAHNPRDLAPRGKAPGARTPRSSSNHQTRRARYHQKTTHGVPQSPTRPRLGVLSALIFPRFQPLAPPCFLLHPPSSSCGKLLEKGRALSPPLPARLAGDGGSQFWPRSKEIFPPKSGPHPFSPLTSGSDRTSPTPSAENIGVNFRREY